MTDKKSIEDTTLGLTGLLLLEAIGLHYIQAETLGAIVGVFVASAVAKVNKTLR